MKKTIKKPLKTTQNDYQVSLKILGKTYTENGESVSDALNKFNIRNIKGVRGIMLVEHNGVKKDRLLAPLQLTRLLNSHGLMKEVAIKNTSTLFEGI